MARLDDDIVAKASFYAGLVQSYSPEELPEDFRANGNTVLNDVIKSMSNCTDVDAGEYIETMNVGDDGVLYRDDEEHPEIDDCVIRNIVNGHFKMTEVGTLEFFTDYHDDKGVYCIQETLEGLVVRTHLNSSEKVTVIKLIPISIDEEFTAYKKIICRKACMQYLIDLLSFRMAVLYQMATQQGLAACMQLSVETTHRPYVNHVTEADPVVGMSKLLHRSTIKNYNNFDRG